MAENENENEQINLEELFNQAQDQTLDPTEALSLIAQRFTEPFREEDLLTTLSELNNKEIVAIARLYPIIQTIEKHYKIQTPLGNFVRFVLLGRISKYRKGRKEILEIVSRLNGLPTFDFTTSRRLFGKD